MLDAALTLLSKINNAGFKAFIVGGFPRDILLGKDSVDVDICTNATPKQIKSIFTDIVIPNDSYGSISLYYKDIRFEITTFRKEIKYTNNRVPVKIEYIDNLVDDLERRDFTINTLCINQNGYMIDLLNGKRDINNRIIKMVGDPKTRLKEDSLRILRAIRFATTLDFNLDDELKKAIIMNKDYLKKLSYFRKKDELEKIFSSSNVKKGLKLIIDLGLDKPLELDNINNIVVTSSIIGFWAQLDVLDKYSFSNFEKEQIIRINELLNLDILDEYNLYMYGLYISTMAGEIKNISKKLITKKYDQLVIHSRKEIDIDTNTICFLLSKKPGPFLKNILSDLEYQIVTGKVKNEASSIKKYILKVY